MGKIINGILGGVSGKVGGVVGSNWKGIPTIRAYAIPANPQSAGQTTQRELFTAVLNFLQLILTTVLQPYWDPFAVGKSGFNVAMSVNLQAWATKTAFDDAIVAQGSLESETIAAAEYATGDGLLDFSWVPAELGDGEDTDTAIIVIVDTTNNIAFVDTSATRVDGAKQLDIGTGRTSATLKSYLFFSRGSGETLVVSNSDFHQVVDG